MEFYQGVTKKKKKSHLPFSVDINRRHRLSDPLSGSSLLGYLFISRRSVHSFYISAF